MTKTMVINEEGIVAAGCELTVNHSGNSSGTIIFAKGTHVIIQVVCVLDEQEVPNENSID